MSIFISAGHSNTDPGAVAEGIKEADVAVGFRNMVAHYLSTWNHPFKTDGSGKENQPLAQAAKEAVKHKVAVEFHCNASTSERSSGVETLSSAKNLALGKALCEVLSKRLKIPNRGAKPENAGQHSKLAFVQAGGLIVELFFLTNPHDREQYEALKWLAAKEVAKVLMEFDK